MPKTAKFRLPGLLALALLPLAAAAADFQVLQRYTLGGEGGWDYLSYDAPSHRLFIARGQHVQVVDPRTGGVVGDIPDTPGVHGIALAPELDKGFTSNGRDNSVSVFTASSLKTTAKIATPKGENPDFIAYDEGTKQVLAFNGRSHDASVIDAVGDKLVATIALAGKPEAAVVDGRGRMFIDIEDTNQLQAIDLKTRAVVATWPLPGCDEPAGLAMDRAARRLFVGCHNKALLVVNADTGKTVAQLPIGEGVDANGFDAERGLVFSSQGDGTLSVIQAAAADRYTPRQTVATARGARTMALDAAQHRVYLVTAEFDEQPAAPGQTRPRRTMKPGSFTLLVVGEK
ncbi:YncE family protein [Pelomonas saccharophila]|nr:YncE family protein [Roseateles saccharophilus]MDG0831671.1 YncE family protein [Roseateles saccharophilus]